MNTRGRNKKVARVFLRATIQVFSVLFLGPFQMGLASAFSSVVCLQGRELMNSFGRLITGVLGRRATAQTTVIVAGGAAVLLGCLGLAVDVGNLRQIRER